MFADGFPFLLRASFLEYPISRSPLAVRQVSKSFVCSKIMVFRVQMHLRDHPLQLRASRVSLL